MKPDFLSLFLFSGTIVRAGQAPVNSPNQCFTPQSAIAPLNFQACCAGQTTLGKGSVAGQTFEYLCNYYPTEFDKAVKQVDDAAACAEVCAEDPPCKASWWKYSSRTCYTTAKENYGSLPGKNWVMLVKGQESTENPADPGPSPDCPDCPDCQELVDSATDACKADAQKCQAEKGAVDISLSQCEQDKASQSQECEKEKATQSQKCEKAKQDIAQKQQQEAETKCQSEKQVLEAQIDGRCKQQQADTQANLSADLGRCQAENTNLAGKLREVQSQQGGRLPGTVLQGHVRQVSDVAYSNDSKILASASNDGTIRLWDTTTGTLFRVLRGHTGTVDRIAFSPNGKQLVSVGADRVAMVWDVATGSVLRHTQYSFHESTPRCVAFSRDGKYIVFGYLHEIKIFDSVTWAQHRRFLSRKDWPLDNVNDISFSADGKQLISAHSNNNVYLWDIADGKPVLRMNGPDWVWRLDLSPDGKKLAVAYSRNVFRLWDVTTGSQLLAQDLPDNALIYSAYDVAFSPDGKYLASAHPGGNLYLWNVARGTQLYRFEELSTVYGVAFSPNGKQLAFSSAENHVRLLEVTTMTLDHAPSGQKDEL